jgi:hypothetical protein
MTTKKKVRDLTSVDLDKTVTYKQNPNNVTSGKLVRFSHALEFTELGIKTLNAPIMAIPVLQDKLETAVIDIEG